MIKFGKMVKNVVLDFGFVGYGLVLNSQFIELFFLLVCFFRVIKIMVGFF